MLAGSWHLNYISLLTDSAFTIYSNYFEFPIVQIKHFENAPTGKKNPQNCLTTRPIQSMTHAPHTKITINFFLLLFDGQTVDREKDLDASEVQ